MKSKLKAAVAAAAVTVLLAACGGDSSGDNGTSGNSTNNGPSASARAVYDFITKLIADNSENSPPLDIDGVTLAVDDNSPPVEFAP